ncbi:O-Antigen ligase [Candidatus Methanoperedenaceae archaeon GB37]|nr:O-Antigen ligase [Candidatus Methanoperedenaceae archaeon GB37]
MAIPISERDIRVKAKKGLFDLPFYLILIHLFFEYGRPQSFFPIIGALHPGYILHTLLFLCLFLKGKLLNFKNIQTKCFLGIILLMTLHGPIAVNNYYAYLIWRGTLLYFIVYLSIVNFVDSFEKIEKYIDIWIIINLFCAFVALKHGGKVPDSGFMGDENDFALVMNMAIPFAYFMFLETNSTKKKILYLSACCIFIAANVASLSRGGFVGLVPVILYCWYKTPKKVLSTVIVAIMISILYFSASSKYWQEVKSIKEENIQKGTGEERIYQWKIGWNMFLDNPLIGVGQGNFPFRFREYEIAAGFYEGLHGRSRAGRAAHSIYFTLIPELGILGILLFGGMIYFSYKDLKWILKIEKDFLFKQQSDKTIQKLHKIRFIIFGITGAMLGYLISGIFLSVLYYPHFWLLIALCVALRNIVQNRV